MRPSARSGEAIYMAAIAAFLTTIVLILVPVPARAEFGFLAKWGSFGSGDAHFNGPYGIAIDSSRNVYVVDRENNRIQKFDSNGNFLGKWGSGGSGDGQFSRPYDVAIDSSDNVYITDFDNDRIQKFDSNGAFLDKWGSTGTAQQQLDGPAGIFIDRSGNVYVSEMYNDRIQKFDPSHNFERIWGWDVINADAGAFEICTQATIPCREGQFGSGPGQLNAPLGVGIDSSNNVYIDDFWNNRIQKFDPNGNFISKWGSSGTGDGQFTWPTGIAIDSSSNVFVTDTANNRIQKFDPNGNFISKWGSSGTGDGQFESPTAVKVNSTNDVYVADTANNRIQKFGELSVPTSPPSSSSPPPPGKPTSEAYKTACNLFITSPKIKTSGKSRSVEISAKKRRSRHVRVSSKRARRLFTHGAKGRIEWGQVNGKDVVCENVKMAILEKRGKRYRVPGYRKIKVPKKNLSVENFPTKAIRLLRKHKIGTLRAKRNTKKKQTNISFKDFNRKSRIGKRALTKLRKKGYRGTFVVIYSAEVDGTTVKKSITLKVKKKKRKKVSVQIT